MSLAAAPILLVEDNHITLEATAELLADDGLEVTCASSGEQAMALLAAGLTPSLVITDIHLDGEPDGLTLARTVASSLPQARLILISGQCRPAAGDYPEKAVFLTKPYASGGLLTLIRSSDW
ncbi:MAG: response regulator [Pseudomonadota bacterium]|nr:response regulator [Pseudomonadota bacterium]